MPEAACIAKRDKRFEQAKWRVLGAIMICYLFFYTGRQNLGFAVKGMQEELAYSTSAITWLNAAMLTGYGLGQAINGNLADMYGARRLVAIGASVSFALNWAMSFAGAVWMSVGLWFVSDDDPAGHGAVPDLRAQPAFGYGLRGVAAGGFGSAGGGGHGAGGESEDACSEDDDGGTGDGARCAQDRGYSANPPRMP